MESLSSTEKILFEYFLNYENLGVSESWTIPEYLANYIDYEAIGRDFTCSGWVLYGGLAICR